MMGKFTRRTAMAGAASPLIGTILPAAAVAAYEAPDAKVRRLCEELSIALCHLENGKFKATVEPQNNSVRPVLLEPLQKGCLQPDWSANMSRGLLMMEQGAMRHDPRIQRLGIIWDMEGNFGGVAVCYSMDRNDGAGHE